MKSNPILIGLLFGLMSGVGIIFYEMSVTLFHLPKDANLAWFLGGTISLSVTFIVQGLFHGAAAGGALKLREGIKSPMSVALHAMIGSLIASLVEYTLLRTLFTHWTVELLPMALLWAFGYAGFFGLLFWNSARKNAYRKK